MPAVVQAQLNVSLERINITEALSSELNPASTIFYTEPRLVYIVLIPAIRSFDPGRSSMQAQSIVESRQCRRAVKEFMRGDELERCIQRFFG